MTDFTSDVDVSTQNKINIAVIEANEHKFWNITKKAKKNRQVAEKEKINAITNNG